MFLSSISSISQHAAAILFPFFLLITVNFLACEKLAVFIPEPKRPRSPDSLFSLGSLQPILIFWISSLGLIPSPLSTKLTKGSSLSEGQVMLIFDAFAVIELSIMSAIAELRL